MLRTGLYRDRTGRAVSVQTTGTGYLLRYADGDTLAISARRRPGIDGNAAVLAPPRCGHE